MFYYPYGAFLAQPPAPLYPPPARRTIIDSGVALKNRTGRLRVQFTKNFTRPPIVVISPFWRGQGSQIGYVETIDSVTRNNFTVVSNNAAENYFINWIAIQED